MHQSRLRGACVSALVVAAACSAEPPPARTPPPGAKRVDVAKAGRIAGRVAIEGPVPANTPIETGSDPYCATQNKNGMSSEAFAVEAGGLNNVFVYVKDGLGNYYFDAPATAVTLDQKGCRYMPHVFGAQAGQPIEIVNSDATLHNVNAVANVNRGFNFGQRMEGLRNTRSFTEPEVMVRIKCDVHGWMNTYVGVLPHPYFAVTSGGGKFELANVPAGSYVVEAWHEKLGTQAQNVALGEKESKELSFTFKAASGD
jgi:plastocyanin